MEYKNSMVWRRLKLSDADKERYYHEIIKPLIWNGITFKQINSQKLILCSWPIAIKLTKLYGNQEDHEKSKENTSNGKASAGKKQAGRPGKHKGKKYEDYMSPEKAAAKREHARKFWKENNPRKYWDTTKISRGQALLFEKVKSIFPGAQIEYPVNAPGKKYYLDVAVPELKLNFEYDGFYWHSFPEAIERDRIRDEYLKSLGWKVFRYSFSARNSLEVKEELLKLEINLENYE